MKNLLLRVSNLLDEHRVDHCLMFGTLLGAVRNNDFIEKDDIDLGIFEQFWKDDAKWRQFNYALKLMGLRVRDMAYNYICIDDYTNNHVDLYLLIKKEKCWQIKVTGILAEFPREDFDNLDSMVFCDKEFLVPADVEKHLEHNYGKDWKIPQSGENLNCRRPINNYEKITYTYIISVEK